MPANPASRIAAVALLLSAALPATAESRDGIDYNRDVRPLLSDRCYKCHGPDAATRQANLRLDRRDGALDPRGDRGSAIVPGRAVESLLFQKISARDPDVRMPPRDARKTLTDDEIDRLRRWIDGGAVYDEHWSFRPPPALPEVAEVPGDVRSHNPIDGFVLAELERKGLTPSPQASSETLIRRVTLDLTGLPPTLEEIDAFLGDDRSGGWERLVDGLLDSPRYGERMAMPWLDLARYADTHGYHYDNQRTMWPWRDWVIDAFNDNLPFDEFTIEQLAGDLLDEPTIEQRIATGFNRNHGISWEGGIIPEEYQVEYVVDRVVTTATTWLGLTMQCARCHDHKFDPISQREFYAFVAFFNTIPEKGADGIKGNAVPFIAAPAPEHTSVLEELERAIEEIQRAYDAPDPELDRRHSAWLDATATWWRARWTTLLPFSAKARGGATLLEQGDGSLFADGPHPDAEVYEVVAFTDRRDIRGIRLEAMADERLPEGGPGRAFHANIVLSEFELEITPISDPSKIERVDFSAAHADHSQRGFHVANAIDGRRETGWALNGARFGEDRAAIFIPVVPFGYEGGTALRVRLRFDSDYTKHALGRIRLSITTDPALGTSLSRSVFGPWHVVGPFRAENGKAAFEQDFGPETSIDLDVAVGEQALHWSAADYPDGVVHKLPAADNSAVYLHRMIDAASPRTITVSLGSDDGIKVWVNGEPRLARDDPRGAAPDQDIVKLPLRAGRNILLLKISNYGGPQAFYFGIGDDTDLDTPLPELTRLARPREQRTPEQVIDLREYWVARHSTSHADLLARLRVKHQEHAVLMEDVPSVMVMQEMDDPRMTHVLHRGRYDAPGEQVKPSVPAVLGAMPDELPRNRLGLAQWLTSPEHPLTARVAVNRNWRLFFGRGLVETTEDFGAQGAMPSHPALLDFLARWYVDSGWDTKALVRLIVTSSTYRQDTASDAALLTRDPTNILLARGPRVRLTGETIRDQALFAGGLLHEQIGGPPVKPYQPDGLWREVGSDFEAFSANLYRRDSGPSLYRRSLYTFWKRTLPPPSMSIFDAPTREFCVARRSRTNTPLQALVLLNDPTFVEAARFLAQRMLIEPGPDAAPAGRVELAFRIVTARRPTGEERSLLVDLYDAQRESFAGDPDGVRGLLGVGDGVHRDDLDRVELAAWTVVASTILNLDEAITKG